MNKQEVADLLYHVQRQQFYACEIINELDQRELEGIQIAKELNRVRKDWLKDRNELDGFRTLITQYDADAQRSTNREEDSKHRLNEARRQITILNDQLLRAKGDIQNYEEVMVLVREVLNDERGQSFICADTKRRFELFEQKRADRKMASESFSILSDVDISYDRSEDNLDDINPPGNWQTTAKEIDLDTSRLRNGRQWPRKSPRARRSRSRSQPKNHKPILVPQPAILEESEPHMEPNASTPPPKKRSRGSDVQENDVVHTTFPVNPGEGVTVTSVFKVHPANTGGGTRDGKTTIVRQSTDMRRSFSEPHIASNKPPFLEPFAPTLGAAGSSYTLRGFPSTTSLPASRLNRDHIFTDKTAIANAVHCERCKHLDRKSRIDFAGRYYKCDNCAITLCSKCHLNPPLPCVPKSSTPRKDQKGDLIEFVNKLNRPQVPHILIHLINEIERRGVGVVGIYRTPGSELDVKKLLSEFLWGKLNPNVREVNDISVLTSCVKRFLSQDVLRQPLIPHGDWHDFVRASENDSNVTTEIFQCICALPIANRDTLAFMIEHLQRVADASDQNKMTIDNLAMVFGPTIVGHSCEFPKPDLMWQEVGKAKMVLIKLLKLPCEFLSRFTNQCIDDGIPLVNPNVFTPGATTSGSLNRGATMANYGVRHVQFGSALPPTPSNATNNATIYPLLPSSAAPVPSANHNGSKYFFEAPHNSLLNRTPGTSKTLNKFKSATPQSKTEVQRSKRFRPWR